MTIGALSGLANGTHDRVKVGKGHATPSQGR